MAKKRESFSLWFPIGIGILICAAPLKWPDSSSELFAVGSAIVAWVIAYRWTRFLPAVLLGALAGIITLVTFWSTEPRGRLSTPILQEPPSKISENYIVNAEIDFDNIEQESNSNQISVNITVFNVGSKSIRFKSLNLCHIAIINIKEFEKQSIFGCEPPNFVSPVGMKKIVGNPTIAEIDIYNPSKFFVDGIETRSFGFEIGPQSSKLASGLFERGKLDWKKIQSVQLGVVFQYFDKDGSVKAVSCVVLRYWCDPPLGDFQDRIVEKKFELLPWSGRSVGVCRDQIA